MDAYRSLLQPPHRWWSRIALLPSRASEYHTRTRSGRPRLHLPLRERDARAGTVFGVLPLYLFWISPTPCALTRHSGAWEGTEAQAYSDRVRITYLFPRDLLSRFGRAGVRLRWMQSGRIGPLPGLGLVTGAAANSMGGVPNPYLGTLDA